MGKVIKASSRRAAAQMCVNDCAKRKGCTGFFYQKHKNGHQICGFYSSKIGAGTWHGHAEGAVCRHYKTTRHEVKGQVAEAEEFLADAEAPETEVDDVEEEQSLSRWPYVVRSGRDCIGGAFKCGHGSLHTAYRACEASRHWCGRVPGQPLLPQAPSQALPSRLPQRIQDVQETALPQLPHDGSQTCGLQARRLQVRRLVL